MSAGSFASISTYPLDFRFTRDSDRKADMPGYPLSASTCHVQCIREYRY